MAARITETTGEAVALVSGGRGEFSIWVDGRTVAQKSMFGFPSEDEVLAATVAALGGAAPGR